MPRVHGAMTPPADRSSPAPPAAGGPGGAAPDGRVSPLPTVPGRGDLRLIERAIRQQWELPEALFRVLPAALLEIVAQRDAERRYVHQPRNRIMAARVLALLHAQNDRQEIAAAPPVQRHEHRHLHLSLDERRAALVARLDQPGE